MIQLSTFLPSLAFLHCLEPPSPPCLRPWLSFLEASANLNGYEEADPEDIEWMKIGSEAACAPAILILGDFQEEAGGFTLLRFPATAGSLLP